MTYLIFAWMLIFAWLPIYLLVGVVIAIYSGTHLYFFTMLWPWAIAAQIVKWITGQYPKWTPQL